MWVAMARAAAAGRVGEKAARRAGLESFWVLSAQAVAQSEAQIPQVRPLPPRLLNEVVHPPVQLPATVRSLESGLQMEGRLTIRLVRAQDVTAPGLQERLPVVATAPLGLAVSVWTVQLVFQALVAG